MRNFVNLTTASAIAITSVMATVAPAAASTKLASWEDRIAQAKAFEERTGRKGGWTRGRHSDKAFKALSGVDGWMFGNILGDDDASLVGAAAGATVAITDVIALAEAVVKFTKLRISYSFSARLIVVCRLIQIGHLSLIHI